MNFDPNEKIETEVINGVQVDEDPIEQMNKESNKTKRKVIVFVYIAIVMVIAIVSIYFAFNGSNESPKPVTPVVPDCSIAYDCELYTKSEYMCKYKDSNDEEKDIKCPWTAVKANQQKKTEPTSETTTTVKTNAGEKTTTSEVIDGNKRTIDYYMSNNVYSDIYPIDYEVPSNYEKTNTINYSLNGKNHVYEEYTWFTKDEECKKYSDTLSQRNNCILNNMIFKIDGKTYGSSEYPVTGINYSFETDIIKDTVTGKEYFVIYDNSCPVICYSAMMIIDDNNVMRYYTAFNGRYSLVEDYKNAPGFYKAKNKGIAYISDDYQSSIVVGAAFEMTNGKLSIRRESNTWDGKWYGYQ